MSSFDTIKVSDVAVNEYNITIQLTEVYIKETRNITAVFKYVLFRNFIINAHIIFFLIKVVYGILKISYLK